MSPEEHARGRFVRLIAAERTVRGLVLIGAGVYLLNHTGHDLGKLAERLARASDLNPQRPIIRHLIDRLGRLHTRQVTVLAAAGIAYGVLELVEGVGLWMELRWAEWLTVIATSLLIPFELYELATKPTLLKAGGLVVNVVVVIYLYRVVSRKGRIRRASGASSPRRGHPPA